MVIQQLELGWNSKVWIAVFEVEVKVEVEVRLICEYNFVHPLSPGSVNSFATKLGMLVIYKKQNKN